MISTPPSPAVSTPLVSIVMPAWQPRADWFEAALCSVLSTDTCDVEVVVVDDGSEPPVEIPIDDPRIQVIRVPHGGPYAARNAGLRVANGTHIRFMDADDVASPGSTARLLRRLDGRDDVLAYGETEMCDEALRPYRRISEQLEGDVAEACVLGGFDVYHVSMIFPRRIIDEVGEWDPGFGVSGDWDFVLRAVEHATVRRLDEVVTSYRRSPGSVMSRARIEEGYAARQRVIERFSERHTGQQNRRLIRRATGRMHVDSAAAHAWRGERRAALRAMGRALVHTPLDALRVSVRLLITWVRRSAPTP